MTQSTLRTQSRAGVSTARDRIRQAAKTDKRRRFTTLLHHVYDIGTLREAYFGLKRDAAAGVDGETWRVYGEQLEAHLVDLSDRLQRGAYRAKPVRRVLIPKPLLANVYLHYVFDLWIHVWRRRAKGDVIVVRYADDRRATTRGREVSDRTEGLAA